MPKENMTNYATNQRGRQVIPLIDQPEQYVFFCDFMEKNFTKLIRRAKRFVKNSEDEAINLVTLASELFLSGRCAPPNPMTTDTYFAYFYMLMWRESNKRFWVKRESFYEGRKILPLREIEKLKEEGERDPKPYELITTQFELDIAHYVKSASPDPFSQLEIHHRQLFVKHLIQNVCSEQEQCLLDWYLDGMSREELRERYNHTYKKVCTLNAISMLLRKIKWKLIKAAKNSLIQPQAV